MKRYALLTLASLLVITLAACGPTSLSTPSFHPESKPEMQHATQAAESIQVLGADATTEIDLEPPASTPEPVAPTSTHTPVETELESQLLKHIDSGATSITIETLETTAEGGVRFRAAFLDKNGTKRVYTGLHFPEVPATTWWPQR